MQKNGPLIVVASPAFWNKAVNPYNFLLYRALQRMGVKVQESSIRTLAFSPVSIWHVHWPELEFGGHSPTMRFYRTIKFLLEILIARLRRIRIIWTVHNVRPHDRAFSRFQELVFRLFLKSLDAFISLTNTARADAMAQLAALRGLPNFVIPHGPYQQAYPNHISRDTARRALGIPDGGNVMLFFGRIRPYKGVVNLIQVYQQLSNRDVHLVIAGRVAEDEWKEELIRMTERDPSIHTELELIPEDRVQNFMQAADLVVLPYQAILNSGTILLALSFERPVLVPNVGSMAELQAVFGDSWVMTYRDPLDATQLIAALESSLRLRAEHAEQLQKAMAENSWERIAAETLLAYRAVLCAD